MLWTPVLAGLCSYRDVKESKVSLGDLYAMNELLAVCAYNNWLLQQDRQEQQEAAAAPPANPFDVFRRAS